MIQQPTPPHSLKKVQHWFAKIITRPIDIHDHMHPISPSGILMEKEAVKYIAPSPTLSSAERIEIYNQQYWWRLLSTLQESYPLLLRLFGKTDFNQSIAFPYLTRYLSNHWSLIYLGSKLPYWTKRYYQASDKKLVHLAATVDHAYLMSFIAKECPSVALSDLEQIMEVKLYLQPHIFMYQIHYPFFEFRETMLDQSPEYWEDHCFPPLLKESPRSYILWRDCFSNVGWVSLDNLEFHILKQFKKGLSFDQLCERLEKLPSPLYTKACQNLQMWTQKWVVNEWLTTENTSR